MKKKCLSCGVRFVRHGENLDVVRTSGDQESSEPQGFPPNLGSRGITASFGPLGPTGNPFRGRRYRLNGTDRITSAQAGDLLEAVAFATEIGLPLRAHVTVMWSLTMAFNDHEGRLPHSPAPNHNVRCSLARCQETQEGLGRPLDSK